MLHRSGVALHYERVALGAASGDSPACTTCIHAAGSFLAVGTTDGKVFLYREHDRRGLQPHYELMCTAQAPELVRSSCTCVQLFPRRNGVALAAGTMRGVVIVFELERVPADSVPKLALKHIVRAHLEVLDQSSVNDDPDSVAGGISCMLWATRGHERTGGGPAIDAEGEGRTGRVGRVAGRGAAAAPLADGRIATRLGAHGNRANGHALDDRRAGVHVFPSARPAVRYQYQTNLDCEKLKPPNYFRNML